MRGGGSVVESGMSHVATTAREMCRLVPPGARTGLGFEEGTVYIVCPQAAGKRTFGRVRWSYLSTRHLRQPLEPQGQSGLARVHPRALVDRGEAGVLRGGALRARAADGEGLPPRAVPVPVARAAAKRVDGGAEVGGQGRTQDREKVHEAVHGRRVPGDGADRGGDGAAGAGEEGLQLHCGHGGRRGGPTACPPSPSDPPAPLRPPRPKSLGLQRATER